MLRPAFGLGAASSSAERNALWVRDACDYFLPIGFAAYGIVSSGEAETSAPTRLDSVPVSGLIGLPDLSGECGRHSGPRLSLMP